MRSLAGAVATSIASPAGRAQRLSLLGSLLRTHGLVGTVRIVLSGRRPQA
jgi:hypothetical protein